MLKSPLTSILKGGLISKSLSFWLKSQKMNAKSRPWDAQDLDLAPILGGLSKSEKLSEIKQPLVFEDFSYSGFLF